VDLYLGLLFCSTDPNICFCASTMLFFSLCLSSIVWSLYSHTSSIALFAQYCLGYSWSFVLPNKL
jgi:hypothetical protein